MDGYLGEIRIFAGTYAPEGWVFCDGSLLQISTNNALFSLIGTTYGGDGKTTFGVPDLRGALAIGCGQPVAPLTGNYPFASTGGVGPVTITEATMPAHQHPQNASTAVAAATSPAIALYATMTAPAEGYVNMSLSPKPPSFNTSPGMLSTEGGNVEHRNDMPTLGLSYIIATTGTYPSFTT